MSAVDLLALTHPPYDGLDLLSTAVLLVDSSGRIAHVNQSAELLFDTSRKTLIGQLAGRVLGDDAEMRQLVADAQANAFGQRKQIMELHLSLIHISEPTRLLSISYAVFCLKK